MSLMKQAKATDFKGVLIVESLSDMSVLESVEILSTEVETVTKGFKTPWLKQWTLHTVRITEDKMKSVANKISKSIDKKHKSSWFADFENKTSHYIVFCGKVFNVDKSKDDCYGEAYDYGISIGIPAHQLRGFKKEARSISSRHIVKQAAPSKGMLDNRALFETLFASDFAANKNKVYAIADQYFDKFKALPEFQKNLDGLKSIDDVIKLSQVIEKPLTPKEQRLLEFHSLSDWPHQEAKAATDKLRDSNVELKNYDWIDYIMSPDEEWELEADPIEEIIQSVETYQRVKDQLVNSPVGFRELTSFNTLSELRNYLDEALVTDKSHYLSKVEPQAKDPRYTDYIYDSPNFIVVLSGTKESSQWWAQGTQWCTGYIEDNRFSDYSRDGTFLYYVITKKDSPLYSRSNPMRKMSLGFDKGSEDLYGQPQLILGEHVTVDSENHEISWHDIERYLDTTLPTPTLLKRTESDAIFAAIYADLDKRDTNKFNEVIINMTPEEFKAAEPHEWHDVEHIISTLIGQKVTAFIMYNPSKPKVGNPDTIEAAAIELAYLQPGRILDNYKGLSAKATEIAAKSQIEDFPYDFMESYKDKYPEFAEIASLEYVEYYPEEFIDEVKYSYEDGKFEKAMTISLKWWLNNKPEKFKVKYIDESPDYRDNRDFSLSDCPKTAALAMKLWVESGHNKTSSHSTEQRLTKLSSALTLLGLTQTANLVKSAFINEAKIVVNKTPDYIAVHLLGKTSYGERDLGETSAYILKIKPENNLANGKPVWHQDRSVDPTYIGLGYGRDMMCALLEAIDSEGGVSLSHDDPSDMAKKNNSEKLGNGFKVTRVCILRYMSEKWLLEADFDNIMALIEEKVFANWDDYDVAHVQREVRNGVWNAVSEDYYTMPSHDMGDSGIKIETGLMIEWRGAKSSIPVKLDTDSKNGYYVHPMDSLSADQRAAAYEEDAERDAKVIEMRGIKPMDSLPS